LQVLQFVDVQVPQELPEALWFAPWFEQEKANWEINLVMFWLWHAGQETSTAWDWLRMSLSKIFSHCWHLYSYTGIYITWNNFTPPYSSCKE